MTSFEDVKRHKSVSRVFKIDTQFPNFSQSPDRLPNPRFLFVRIVRRIGGGQLGLRLHSPNGQITEFREILQILQISGDWASPWFLFLTTFGQWVHASSWSLPYQRIFSIDLKSRKTEILWPLTGASLIVKSLILPIPTTLVVDWPPSLRCA